MKKIVKLTEEELTNMIKQVIYEQGATTQTTTMSYSQYKNQQGATTQTTTVAKPSNNNASPRNCKMGDKGTYITIGIPSGVAHFLSDDGRTPKCRIVK